MEKEITEVYCGNGRGKTTLAIGQALRASSQGKSVIIIQFLKGNERRESRRTGRILWIFHGNREYDR